MTEPSTQHVPVCFVSDLHLFSHRSRGHLIDEQIMEAARRSRVCVLGGDIFDFKWSAHSSHEASLVEDVSAQNADARTPRRLHDLLIDQMSP